MFVEIGDSVLIRGKRYTCMGVDGDTRRGACARCALRMICTNEDIISLDCSKYERKDKRDAYFVESQRRSKKKRVTVDKLFERLSVFVSNKRYLEYKRVSVDQGTQLTLRTDDKLLFAGLFDVSGNLTEYVIPDMKPYSSSEYFIKVIGSSLWIYSDTGRVRSVDLTP